MARRDPFTRPITIALGSALLVRAIAGTYKLLGAKPARHAAATTTQPAKPLAAKSLAHATTEPAKVAVVKPLTVNVPTAPTPAPVMLAATTTQPRSRRTTSTTARRRFTVGRTKSRRTSSRR